MCILSVNVLATKENKNTSTHRNDFKEIESQKQEYNKICAVTVVKYCSTAKDAYVRMGLAHLVKKSETKGWTKA